MLLLARTHTLGLFFFFFTTLKALSPLLRRCSPFLSSVLIFSRCAPRWALLLSALCLCPMSVSVKESLHTASQMRMEFYCSSGFYGFSWMRRGRDFIGFHSKICRALSDLVFFFLLTVVSQKLSSSLRSNRSEGSHMNITFLAQQKPSLANMNNYNPLVNIHHIKTPNVLNLHIIVG